MLKKYIYLIIIPIIFISCSKPTVVGEWRTQRDTIFKTIKTSSDMNYYYDLELKEKLASQISDNTIYSFSKDGFLSIDISSPADSADYTFSGSWRLLDSNIIEISIDNNMPSLDGSEKYKIKLSDSLMILESISDTTRKILLEKK